MKSTIQFTGLPWMGQSFLSTVQTLNTSIETHNRLMKVRPILVFLVGFLCHCLIVPQLSAQGTAFTYQGRLSSGGASANGLYDFKFRLYDSINATSDFVGPITNSAVNVSNGLFTAVLDFGGDVFTGHPNFFLEIWVRPTGASTDFFTLSPRQHITPTPYAIHAGTATTATSLVDGSVSSVNGVGGEVTLMPGQNVVIFTNANRVFISVPTGGNGPWAGAETNIYYEGGFVGIGTIFPDRPLTINASGPGNEWLSFRVGGATRWHINNRNFGWNLVETGAADFRLFVAPGGNIGVGTESPLAKLDVRGGIRFGVNSEHRAVSASDTLHIIRGTVSSGGAVLDGTGFTVNHAATGDYGITFSTPFATRPTVTASVEWEFPVSDPARVAMVDNFTASGGNIVVTTTASQTLLNARFNFIAIGVR